MLFKKKRRMILIRAGDARERLPHALLSLPADLDDVLILDKTTSRSILKYKDIIENTNHIGFSIITGPYIKYSLEVARVIRSINPQRFFVWNGWHFSSN